MTDDHMDARLRAAGERWRSGVATAVAEPPDHDGFELLELTPHRPRRRWIALASAAVLVTAVTIAGALFATNRRGTGHAPAAGPPQGAELRAHSWQVPGFAEATIAFTAHTVHFADGCDAGTRKMRVDGNRLIIGPRVGLMSACTGAGAPASGSPPAPSSLDLASVLDGTVTWSISGERLTLAKPGVGTREFVPAGVTSPVATQITDVRWSLIEIARASRTGSSKTVAAIGDTTLEVSDTGRFTVAHSCYENQGPTRRYPTTLKLTMTKRIDHSCPFSSNRKQEARENMMVDRALEGTVSWTITAGGQLTITKGGTRLIFEG